MRLIGHLPNEGTALTFSNFLYVEGISNVVEPEKDAWAVWIHSEDEIETARELLRKFLANPADPVYRDKAKRAGELKDKEQKEEEQGQKRYFDRERLFGSSAALKRAPLTWLLIFASIVVTLMLSFGVATNFVESLYLSSYWKGAPEIRKGELWRLITPIFIHANLKDSTLGSFGFLHIFFNSLWMATLGVVVESRQGTWRFILLIFLMAAVSNYAQYQVSGPRFGGLSGVTYGLLGYIWMKGKFDTDFDVYLPPQTVTMMLAWFFLCMFNVIPNVANVVHGVGLVFGMAWGFLSSFKFR